MGAHLRRRHHRTRSLLGALALALGAGLVVFALSGGRGGDERLPSDPLASGRDEAATSEPTVLGVVVTTTLGDAPAASPFLVPTSERSATSSSSAPPTTRSGPGTTRPGSTTTTDSPTVSLIPPTSIVNTTTTTSPTTTSPTTTSPTTTETTTSTTESDGGSDGGD